MPENNWSEIALKTFENLTAHTCACRACGCIIPNLRNYMYQHYCFHKMINEHDLAFRNKKDASKN